MFSWLLDFHLPQNPFETELRMRQKIPVSGALRLLECHALTPRAYEFSPRTLLPMQMTSFDSISSKRVMAWHVSTMNNTFRRRRCRRR